AAVTSLVQVSFVGLLGLTSTPKRSADGRSSRSNPNPFAPSSVIKKFTPVALPPGRAKLATRPSLTGSSLMLNTTGIVLVASFTASAATGLPGVAITVSDQIGYQVRQPIVLALCEAILDRDVLTLNEARVVQTLPKSRHEVRDRGRRTGVQPPDDRNRCLLRARRERPRGCRAAEQRDDLAPLHSITSSARASTL